MADAAANGGRGDRSARTGDATSLEGRRFTIKSVKGSYAGKYLGAHTSEAKDRRNASSSFACGGKGDDAASVGVRAGHPQPHAVGEGGGARHRELAAPSATRK